MRQFKLLLIAAFATLAFSAVASAAASAEEDKGSPSILVTNATTFEVNSQSERLPSRN